MTIALGSDHRGFAAKENIKSTLTGRGVQLCDFGTANEDSCDYPDAGIPAAQAVATGRCDWGILFCGTGIGMSIAANKVRGVRASLCFDELTAEMARRHNDANVLCVPVDLLGDDVIERIVKKWLDTPFDGGRHARRVNKITQFEDGS